MAAAVWLLWGVLAISLSLPLLGWPVMFVAAGSLVVMALIVASIAVPASRLEIGTTSLRFASLLAVTIGLGILLQVVPLKSTGLAHPLWSAMGAAVGQPVIGYITVDAARTVVALAKYLVIVGAALAVALTCVNQRRSGQMISGLAWLLAIFAAICLVKMQVHGFSSVDGDTLVVADWVNLSRLSLLMAAAIVLQRLQLRRSSRKRLPPQQRRNYLRRLVPAIGLVALFSVPLIVLWPRASVIPLVCGASILLTVLLIDRTRSGVGGTLFAIILMICTLWLSGIASGIVGPRSIAWVEGSEHDVATAAGIFHDFRWFGSGAGTYSQLIPIYMGAQDGGSGLFDAPPTVLSLLIELGIPLTLLTGMLAVALAWTLISTIVQSRRDYSQAILACSVLVYVVACAFTPGMSLSFPTMIVAAVMIGLGLAQAQRRRPVGVASYAGPRQKPQGRAVTPAAAD